MKNIYYATSDGYTVETIPYTLHISGARVEVIIEGTRFATLDIRSAVPMTNSDDSGAIQDSEPEAPILTDVREEDNSVIFVWTGKSSLWKEKLYTLSCDRLRFTYAVTVRGKGRVDAVEYFSGDISTGFPGSEYEFSEGFTPCKSWFENEDYTFKASVSCHRWSVLMVPPMFCYAFRCDRVGSRLGLGLVAKRGEHNFNSFDYKVSKNRFNCGFKLVTDQAGHVSVNGEWTSPMILGFSGDDQWDVLSKYTDYYFSSGIAKAPTHYGIGRTPRFWHGPIACGWIEQMILADRLGDWNKSPDFSTEATYEEIISKLARYNLKPKALIIDDKWQSHYATDEADPSKFPDMRAFVERRHAEGIKTLLWFKLWDPDGLDDSFQVTADNGEKRYDPSKPEFTALLDEALRRILSSDDDCYNCDGLKLDFAFWIPIGRKVKTYSGKYGVELLYELTAHIYEKAKELKPNAMINASPCHPYFAHITDIARLHDYEQKNRNNREDLSMRARLFSTAMPGVLLDTDNAAFASRRDSMNWLLNQPLTGVPDLYAFSGTKGCPLDDSDFAAIAQLWQEYSAKIDAYYN